MMIIWIWKSESGNQTWLAGTSPIESWSRENHRTKWMSTWWVFSSKPGDRWHRVGYPLKVGLLNVHFITSHFDVHRVYWCLLMRIDVYWCLLMSHKHGYQGLKTHTLGWKLPATVTFLYLEMHNYKCWTSSIGKQVITGCQSMKQIKKQRPFETLTPEIVNRTLLLYSM